MNLCSKDKVNAQLICVFVFASATGRLSNAVTQVIETEISGPPQRNVLDPLIYKLKKTIKTNTEKSSKIFWDTTLWSCPRGTCI